MDFLKTLFRRVTPQTENTTMTGTIAVAVRDEAPVRTNLAEELRVAEASFAEATRKKRINEDEIANTNRAVENIASKLSTIAPDSIENRMGHIESQRRGLHELRLKLDGLQAKNPAINKELEDSQAKLHRVRRQITEHPVYAAAVAEQMRLIAEGTKSAEQIWSGPLSNLSAAVKLFEAIADREAAFEQATNARLRAVGLPELRAQLWNCRSCVPSVIANFPLDEIKANCNAALEQLRTYRGGIPEF